VPIFWQILNVDHLTLYFIWYRILALQEMHLIPAKPIQSLSSIDVSVIARQITCAIFYLRSVLTNW